MGKAAGEGEKTMAGSIRVFISYAHEDEAFLKQLEKHLAFLHRQGLISTWYDRNISAGTEWAHEIDVNLSSAQIILLLVSANFLASEYCYSTEMKQAMERHERGEAHVIPIILRPVSWQDAPFGKLQALPNGAKPVIRWRSRDEAFLDIARELKETAEKLSINAKAVSPSRETYGKMWGAAQPGYLIFLLNQSASMSNSFGLAHSDVSKRKCDMAASVLNSFLSELLAANTIPHPDGSSEVRPRADVTILGYSNGSIRSILGGMLSGKVSASLPELQTNPISVEVRKRWEIDEAGQRIEIPITFPIWIEPKAEGSAPMCAALQYAQALIKGWFLLIEIITRQW
jgi:hypothetical protein